MSDFYKIWVGDSPTIASVFKVRPIYRAPFQIVGEPLMADIKQNSRVWTDLIRTNQFTLLLFSERWVNMANEQGWTGVEFWPIAIRNIDSEYLRAKAHLPYYWAKILAKVGVNGLPATGSGPQPNPETGRFQRPHDSPCKAWVDSFDGDKTDFFNLSNVWATDIFCSARVRNAVLEHRWTNVDFTHPSEENGRKFFNI